MTIGVEATTSSWPKSGSLGVSWDRESEGLSCLQLESSLDWKWISLSSNIQILGAVIDEGELTIVLGDSLKSAKPKQQTYQQNLLHIRFYSRISERYSFEQ
jgi:hypothetical protein